MVDPCRPERNEAMNRVGRRDLNLAFGEHTIAEEGQTRTWHYPEQSRHGFAVVYVRSPDRMHRRQRFLRFGNQSF